MQYHWLNKKNNKDLIVFFCGWSFDDKPFSFLDCKNFDVLVVYNYSKIDKIEVPAIKYEKKFLVSWSFGVFISYALRGFLPNFDAKIAVNGTPFPIDNEFGIPEKIFDLTLKNVQTSLQGKIQRNMFLTKQEYERFLTIPPERSIEDCSYELGVLKSFFEKHKEPYVSFFNRAIISDVDRIFPTKNQLNFWEKRVSVKNIESGHFPFYNFESWDDILQCKPTLKQ